MLQSVESILQNTQNNRCSPVEECLFKIAMNRSDRSWWMVFCRTHQGTVCTFVAQVKIWNGRYPTPADEREIHGT